VARFRACIFDTVLRPVGGWGVERWVPPLSEPLKRSSHRETAEKRRRLELLLGRAHEHLVHGYAPRSGDDIGDRVGDIFGLEPLDPGGALL
jgi:hypothetical protein